MSKARVQLFTLLAFSLSVLSVINFARMGAPSKEAAEAVRSSAGDPLLEEIAGYRQWTRVTQTPLLVATAADLGG